MRALCLTAAIVLAIPSAASASDTGPVIAIPGRAGVPVIINGRDASWAVVEGDWGLGKSVHVQPTVLGGWDGYVGREVGGYFPSGGAMPGYGRYEVEGARRKVRPAESYNRSWSAQSAPPAPQEYQQDDIPLEPPPVIPAQPGFK